MTEVYLPTDREIAARCSRDFLSYMAWVKGYLPAEHHLVIADLLLYGEGPRLVLGPPGSGKSSIGAAFIEWVIGRNPNYRWLVASEVGTGIATTVVSEVASTLQFNERYQMCFGDLLDPTGKSPWSSQSITVRPYVSARDARRLKQPPTPPPPFPWLPARGRDLRVTGKHPTVKAVGWRYGYAGARCEGIWGDDLVSDRISRSDRLTQQVYDTLYQKLLTRPVDPVIPRGQPELAANPEYRQHIVLCGQRWAPRDVFGLILETSCVCFDSNPDREGMWVLDPEQAMEVAS